MPSIYNTNIMTMFKYFIALLICLGTTEAFAILPDTVYVRKPEDLGLKYRELNVTTKDGYRIATWFFPAQAQQAANRQGKSAQRPTIIICNGDAGNMSYFQLHLAQAWTAEGFNVATFDWRGFGKSSPFPMDKTTCAIRKCSKTTGQLSNASPDSQRLTKKRSLPWVGPRVHTCP